MSEMLEEVEARGLSDLESEGHVHGKISDAELYRLCCQFGAAALEARRKFLGLLPEVARRRLYERYGFSSIFVFAAKLAGVSEEMVRRTLRLEERFKEMPVLRLQLVNGEVSVNKLARVAAVATVESADFWAAKAESLSKAALETLVRDRKILQKTVPGHTELPEFGQVSMMGDDLELSAENLSRLKELKNRGIDINVLISDALDAREVAIAEEKNSIAKNLVASSSRYIPVRVKKVLAKEFGKKCAIEHCQKPAEEIHHTARFSISGNHDPNFLAPLCAGHHEIAHSVDERYRQKKILAVKVGN